MTKKPLSTSEMMSNADQFETMYTSNKPLIHRFMFWRTKNDMLSEDLTSTVFEKAWKTRRSFRGGSPKAWLYTIARTTLIDYWRKNKEIADDDTISEAVSDVEALDDALNQSMEIARLRTALSKLPHLMHQVVRLRFIEGESARTTATQLGISEANVRVIQYRGLKKLRKILQ